MCGIAGFMLPGRNPRYRELESRLHAMIAMLRHRGPDDAGAWTDGRAGLAHARLSVIDLTPAGHQPMASADGNVWISYNGEIYNFREIRRDLEELGYPFRSRGDAEVIANGWHAWGAEVIPRLRGMFAFALWDRRTSRLILARDRIGKKPLYYALSEGALLFGSEIKALLTWPGLSRIPNLSAIDRYLTLGYVPSPHSAFAGISKLPAAHYLVVNARSRDGISDPELVQYWRLPAHNTGTRRRPEELRRELIERLEEAVRLRLISDVPLGAFLSGGIDSSAVVAMMARAGCGRVKTFSIGFSAKEYDETRFARLVAERYGTDHEELVVEPDAVKILPRLVWHYGEPFADASAIPTYYVSEMARRKVAVALNGDGGDECFLGYNRYRAMYHLSRLDRMPHWSRAGIERLLALAPNALQRRFKIPQIRGVLRAPEESPAQRYASAFASFADDDKEEGYSEAMRGQLGRSAFEFIEPHFAEADDLVTAANRADIHTYLPDDLLVKVDVASMAHGLEARSPLLDHGLMEWTAAIPCDIKMARGVAKALFKSAMRPYLPTKLVSRPKMGFTCPIDRWFRSELKDLAYDILLSRSARERGIFRADYVRLLLDEHCNSGRDHTTRLWSLLMLELWFRMWIDAPAEAAILRPAA